MNINGSVHMLDDNGKLKHQTKSVSNFRNAASQYFAALATNTVMFVSGSFFGFTTVLIAVLDRSDSEIEVTRSQLTWFGSYLFMQPIGALTVGLIAQHIGSRTTLLLGALLFSASCLMFYLAKSPEMILAAQALVALASIHAQGVTYAAEITEPHLRTVIMSTINFSSTFGALAAAIFASFLYWRTVSLVFFTFAVVGLVAMLFIPHSPHWLASKGRFDEAEKALMWLRGWTTPEDVRLEFVALRESHEEHQHHADKQRLGDFVKPFLQRSFFLPLISICYVFTIRSMMGTMTIQIFADIVFKEIFGEKDKSYTDLMLVASYAVDITGAAIFISAVSIIGKRRLMSISLVAAALCYSTVSLFVFLIHRGYDSPVYRWVPSVMVLLSVLVTTAGVDSIVSMLNGELFPSKLRNAGAGIGMFINYTCLSLVGKAFVYVVEAITLQGVFLLFALTCLVGLITFHFILPDTEGRTLAEIEDHYAGIRNLKDRRREPPHDEKAAFISSKLNGV